MGMPPCPARHDLPDEPGLFYCAHPRVHIRDQRVHPGVCLGCTRWAEVPPEGYRPFPPPPRRGRCAHLGPETGLRECVTCGGKVRLKVFACAHPTHSETTLDECAVCPDHAEIPPVAPTAEG